MSNSITAISKAIPMPEAAPAATPSSAADAFKTVLDGMIGRVEGSRSTAQQAVNSFLSGNNEDLHSVALASQRADLEFDMFLQVRNKVVSAYQEIMRMQV